MSTTNGVASSEPMVAEPSKNGFQSFENAAADAVLAICYNSSGKRMATASADHKVRIYETGDPDVNAQPTLTDQWRAHDAEILDVSLSKDVFPFITHSRVLYFLFSFLERKKISFPTFYVPTSASRHI